MVISAMRLKAREPGSAITHFIGFVAAVIGLPIILIHSAARGDGVPGTVASIVFMLSMIALYGASTTYHTFDVNDRVNMILKKIDHMMVFVLIAGSYAPACLLVFDKQTGTRMLAAVWIVAIAGMIFKYCWVTCPKWVSSVIYIAMGWMIVPAIPKFLIASEPGAFAWTLAGGILYSIGGVMYAFKFDVFRGRFKNFGTHELFHVFVLAGSLCHFIAVYFFML